MKWSDIEAEIQAIVPSVQIGDPMKGVFAKVLAAFKQLKAENENLKKDAKIVMETAVIPQRRLNDEAWEENRRLRKALEKCKEQRDSSAMVLTENETYVFSFSRSKWNKELDEIMGRDEIDWEAIANPRHK